MSKIWKKPVVIPAGVEVQLNGSHIQVKWSKGTLERDIPAAVTAKVEWTDASYSNIAYICKEETDVDADCDEARSEDITVSDEGVLTIKKYVNSIIFLK